MSDEHRLQPHLNNSFSYKVINKNIKKVLEARSVLDNTIQLSMPFVKATTTIELPEVLGNGNIGFTLGMHATELDKRWQDLLASPSSGYPLIGYTYSTNTNIPIYAEPLPGSEEIVRLLDLGNDLVTSRGSDYSRVPPPGITKVDIGVYKSGYNRSATIHFTVPSLLQLEVLHRVFLVPGMGMILEWGQQFANEISPSEGEVGLTQSNIDQYLFPWYSRDKLIGPGNLLERLGTKKVGMEEIMENYVYPTQGQYMWMYGNVGGFNVKGQADGSFQCSVRIIGPAEGMFAFSVRNTTIPPRDDSGKVCINNETSVESFFTSTTAGSVNFLSLLEGTLNGSIEGLEEWQGHVIKFDKSSTEVDGESSPAEPSNPQTSEDGMNESEDAYFITWKFFVNVVLNDALNGVKSMFNAAALLEHELDAIGMLRPLANSNGSILDNRIDDPYENFVGNNRYLRSVDPSTMIIVNNLAVLLARAEYQRLRIDVPDDVHADTEDAGKFEAKGDFYNSAIDITDPPRDDGPFDRGLLSSGIWINHKAIIQSMAPAETILSGVQSLLTKMSSATRNFWNLTIDISEPFEEDPNTINFTVMDLNYKESSRGAVEKFLDTEDGVHVFNRYIRERNGVQLGSDVIDCSVELSMPQRLFAQIATIGLVQPEDSATAAGDDPDAYPDTPIISDPNEVFRKMFAITTASTKLPDGRSPDLSIPSKSDRAAALAKLNCGGSVSGVTTAGTSGQGASSSDPNAREVAQSAEDERAQRERTAREASTGARSTLDSNLCRQCVDEPTPTPAPAQPVPPTQGNPCDNVPAGKERDFCNYARSQGITDKIELSQLMANVKTECSFNPVSENLNYRADVLLRLFPKTPNRAWGFDSLEDAQRTVSGGREAVGNRIYGSRMGNNGEGYKYRGRGYIQLTGRENYTNCGRAIGADLVTNPDYLLTEQGARESAVWYWKTRVRTTNFTDTTTVRRRVNGGAIKLEETRGFYNQYLRLFGIENAPAESSSTPTPTQYKNTPECQPCREAQTTERTANQIVSQVQQERTSASAVERIEVVTRQFAHLKTIFKFIEPMGDMMVGNIARSANGNSSNAFGAAPGALAITADITLPGINGIRMGELFWVDRIPAFYRAFGAFQVLSIEDNIGLDGWTTKIHSRFNYLGTAWKNKMAEILLAGTASTGDD
jgi:predicted chitinase